MDNSMEESKDNSMEESMDNSEIIHDKIRFKWDLNKPLCGQASALTTMPAVPDYEITVISISSGKGSSNQQHDEEFGNTHQTESSRTAERDKRIQAAVTKIYGALKIEETENAEPVGLVLNGEMFSGDYEDVQVLEKSSSKEVKLVKDKKKSTNLALKIMRDITIIQLNPYEIKAWVSLADEDSAPELYCFQLNGKDLEFFMEPLQGQTLEKIIDDRKLFDDPKLAKAFALCVLYDLLDKFEKLRKKLFVHGDIHGGNVILQPSMAVKLIDFENASSLRNCSHTDIKNKMKNDIVGIASIFCNLYTGQYIDVEKILQTNDLKLIRKMPHIDKETWPVLKYITRKLLKTVRRRADQPGFGDISKVAVIVKSMLPEDVEIKKKVGPVLFQEGSGISCSPAASQDGTNSRSITEDTIGSSEVQIKPGIEMMKVKGGSGISRSPVVNQDGTDHKSLVVNQDGTDSRSITGDTISDFEFMNLQAK